MSLKQLSGNMGNVIIDTNCPSWSDEVKFQRTIVFRIPIFVSIINKEEKEVPFFLTHLFLKNYFSSIVLIFLFFLPNLPFQGLPIQASTSITHTHTNGQIN